MAAAALHGRGARLLRADRAGRRLAFTENLPPYADRESITLATVTYSPSQILNGVKSLSYAANMQATRLATAQGADEAVLVRPDGIVLEAPTSTIFWVAPDGRLRTPALDVGSYGLDELESASEAFLASTVREVQAISAVNETELPECPGGRTQEAAAAFSRILDRELAASASS